MLRLPIFRHHAPDNLDDALKLLGDLNVDGQKAKLLAGGTDLLPNMKHEFTTPEHVVSLGKVDLKGITVEEGVVSIGAMTSIHDTAVDPLIGQYLPALADACSQIAGPQLRRMGTLGGNICLDTRCLFINQSYFWRSALGFCIKRDGTACHVVEKGQNCVAAASNDSVLPLMLYGAEVHLQSAGEERWLALDKFFVADGVKNTVIEPNEILTGVRIPVPAEGVDVAFEKLRVRKSIDFPLLNVAVLVQRGEDGLLQRLDMVVSALGARPKRITMDKVVLGKTLDDEIIAKAAAKGHASCRPLTNLATDPQWRRDMVPVLIKKALHRLQETSVVAA
jgi:4-hydroxybenzoyl-CoA reductase subunit beta